MISDENISMIDDDLEIDCGFTISALERQNAIKKLLGPPEDSIIKEKTADDRQMECLNRYVVIVETNFNPAFVEEFVAEINAIIDNKSLEKDLKLKNFRACLQKMDEEVPDLRNLWNAIVAHHAPPSSKSTFEQNYSFLNPGEIEQVRQYEKDIQRLEREHGEFTNSPNFKNLTKYQIETEEKDFTQKVDDIRRKPIMVIVKGINANNLPRSVARLIKKEYEGTSAKIKSSLSETKDWRTKRILKYKAIEMQKFRDEKEDYIPPSITKF